MNARNWPFRDVCLVSGTRKPNAALFLATDFGQLYTGATLASMLTVLANNDYENRTLTTPHVLVRRPYDDFDISAGASAFPQDLAQIVELAGNIPISAAFVVDPDKDRRDVLVTGTYRGKRVHIAAPDKGQLDQLLERADFALDGAVKIDKKRIIPDDKIADETHQLWDGHAAYGPAAALALTRPFSEIGGKIETLHGDVAVSQVPRIIRSQKVDNVPTTLIVHYIGSHFSGSGEELIGSSTFEDRVFVIDYGATQSIEGTAYAAFFAGVNIFQETQGVSHLIYVDGEEVCDPIELMQAPSIKYVGPDNPKVYSLLAHALAPRNRILGPSYFETQESDGNYSIAVLNSDANGNIRTNFNPYEHNIILEAGQEIVVGIDGHQIRTTFQYDYTRRDADVIALLNPGHGSRRSRLELAVPHGSLVGYLQRHGAKVPQAGERITLNLMMAK